MLPSSPTIFSFKRYVPMLFFTNMDWHFNLFSQYTLRDSFQTQLQRQTL